MKPIYLSLKNGTPPSGYWDMAFLDDLLKGLPDSDRQIVIIPGAYQGDIIPEINNYLAQYPKVLVFVTSDEEGNFNCELLRHSDMIHYRQYGYCKNIFPIGYTTNTRPALKKIGVQKRDLDLFFAGQLNTHERRRGLSDAILVPSQSVFIGTNGFAQGISSEAYYEYMTHARACLVFSGHVSADSFRFYEALEAGSMPVPYGSAYEFVKKLFPDFPVEAGIDPEEVFAWWIKKKMELRNKIKEDLGIKDAMTVIVPTSPIPSHPSTEIIDQTIKSIRYHMDSDIIITIDGIRPEQEHMRKAYEEYVRKLLWKCNFEYENVMPILSDRHIHQSGMMKEALKHVKTPLLMYVEHDTPLVTDEKIDWLLISKTLFEKTAYVVRFHYEAKIPKEHDYLMLHSHGNQFRATKQWSQRPHVARTDFYNHIMQFFSDDANCFIEDLIYGNCVHGKWEDWRVFIYTPDLFNIKRSLNLDGRAGDKKFEKEQIW